MSLLKYGFTGILDDDADKDVKMILTIAKPLIDRSHESYIRSIAEDLIDEEASDFADEVIVHSNILCDFRQAKLLAKTILQYLGKENHGRMWHIFGDLYKSCKNKLEKGEIKRFWEYFQSALKEELKKDINARNHT